MNKPTRSFLNLTWVGWLNFIILQWFLIRLAYGDKWRLIFWVPPLCGWLPGDSPLYNNAVKHFRWPR